MLKYYILNHIMFPSISLFENLLETYKSNFLAQGCSAVHHVIIVCAIPRQWLASIFTTNLCIVGCEKSYPHILFKRKIHYNSLEKDLSEKEYKYH